MRDTARSLATSLLKRSDPSAMPLLALPGRDLAVDICGNRSLLEEEQHLGEGDQLVGVSGRHRHNLVRRLVAFFRM